MDAATPGLRRLLDAAFNRGREALRTIEDTARFLLDAPGPTGRAKVLRHRLRGMYESLGGDAANIVGRDTGGDVGTSIKTAAELSRPGPRDVLTAACKRLSEALRSLEEFGKILSPAAAAEAESIRYAGYVLERDLSAWFAPSRRFADVRLYVLITEALCNGPWEHVAEAVVDGGAEAVQLREKTAPDRRVLAMARRLRDITAGRAILIINDRPDIAVLSHADGVHVGQTELPARDARRIVGPDRIVGVSTHDLPAARQAVADGADYIGVGPMFPSSTKPRDFTAGPAALAAVVREIPLPHAAIGGITAGNIGELLAVGVRCAAVCGAVISAADPGAAARELRSRLGPRADPQAGADRR